ncbi:helix-turn-helix domain-containing protein [Barrientosiimonas humi]|uniref:helix-turn-helix domain-containing protein n=1 Tax=Barrientosiimonas humi TaxID=999931 RepID=UPI00114D9306
MPEHKPPIPLAGGWLTNRQAALVLGIRPQTLRVYRSRGKGPVWTLTAERRVLYRESDVLAYMHQRRRRCRS